MPLDGVAFPIGNCGFGIWLNCDAVLRYSRATMCGIAVFVPPLRPPQFTNFAFTSESYSGVLSPSFIFSWTTIANISAYFKCFVSYCCSRENETWRQYPLNNEALTKFATKN